MWQSILVGLIVMVAALYAVWALLPAQPRRRLAQAIAARTRNPRYPAWLGRAGETLERDSLRRLGVCGDCGGDPHSLRPRRKRPPSD